MATPYEPPEWGRAGQNTYGISLDVIRNGVLVESLSLPLDDAKSFVVAGRMEPLCDLVLQHPSLSRVHAVLQFDAHGALFVQDMKSTHGTFVNKKRLAPLRFQRLHVGDLVVFGESTRKYAVCGPDELRPEEPDMERLRAKIQASKEAEKKREEREASGATWGFGEDAEEEDDSSEDDDDDNNNGAARTSRAATRQDESDLPEYLRGLKETGRSSYESSVTAADVSEKDQKLLTQLQAKIRKLENLETEKGRILAKHNDLQGLTDGQQQTLDRNSARIESLTKEIAALEDRIHAKNAQRDQSRAAQDGRKKATSKPSAVYDYGSDEDDFYDRTSANQKKLDARKQQSERTGKTDDKKKPLGGEVLTAEIIERKIAMLEKDLEGLSAEYARVQADDGGDGGKDETGEMDALDAFMQSTAKELHAKELARVVTRRTEVETELKKQRQLLAIAMPALRHERPAVAPATSKPMEVKKGKAMSIESDAVELTQPVVKTGTEAVVEEEAKEKVETPPRGSKPKTSQQHPQPPEDDEGVVVEETKPKKRRVMGPTLPPPKATTATVASGAVLEGGDRVWVPPANQTGDGRTALNDKYGY